VDKAHKKATLFVALVPDVVIVGSLDTTLMVNFYRLVYCASTKNQSKANSNVEIVTKKPFGHLTVLLTVESVCDVNVVNEESRVTTEKMVVLLFANIATTAIDNALLATMLTLHSTKKFWTKKKPFVPTVEKKQPTANNAVNPVANVVFVVTFK
jgi:hypothetical protein